MASVNKLEGIRKPQETDLLNGNRIDTIEQLWACIGKNLDQGHDLTGMEQDRLLVLLAAQTVHEDDLKNGSTLKRWLLQGAAVLLLVILGLRALGVLIWLPSWPWLPSPVTLRDTVLVAARDLEVGHTLRANDLYIGRLAPSANYFTSTTELTGTIIAQRVPLGKPLSFTNVLRPQVIATTDILSGTIIETKVISTTWSIYQPSAALRSDQVVGKRARYPIRSGMIISTDFIAAPALMSQVVISATAGLPAFHVITDTDVTLVNARSVSGAFTTITDVVGLYTLQTTPFSATLRADQLLSQLPLGCHWR